MILLQEVLHICFKRENCTYGIEMLLCATHQMAEVTLITDGRE